MLLPQSGSEIGYFGRWMLGYTLQNINEIAIDIDPVQPGGDNRVFRHACLTFGRRATVAVMQPSSYPE